MLDLISLYLKSIFQIHKIIGFAPTLLQVVMMNDVDMPVRQAGVIYLKNMVTNNWADRETEAGQPMPFSIHEQDRAMIRDAIVDAVVHATELIRFAYFNLCLSYQTFFIMFLIIIFFAELNYRFV